ISVTGGGAVSYQWFGPSGAISGATSASYTKTPSAVSDTGDYHVVVSAPGAQDVTSNTATVTVTATTTPTLKTIKISKGTGTSVVGGTDAAPTLSDTTLVAGGSGEATAQIDVVTDVGASLPINTTFTLTGTDALKFSSTGLVTGTSPKTLHIKIASGTTAGTYDVVLNAGTGVTLPIKITVA
ncbi:UNVERIFIED_CONTAM: hypothetical protein RF648_20115, partial [Kocuria sp. CPCC 205274]